ncbi:unnamed protein product [Cuscuta epithymum]|uniref:Uncharacterized protein n=1 Tax=Cuscuta epithymum TaxID=186058 RepID=A0AAV0FT06_9ASTE|nr:unnamed protein product [Cuscuta epithymum]
MGENGPTISRLRKMGRDPTVHIEGQDVPGIGRSVGAGLPPAERRQEMDGQDLRGERVLFARLLGRDRREAGQHHGEQGRSQDTGPHWTGTKNIFENFFTRIFYTKNKDIFKIWAGPGPGLAHPQLRP